jgi:hypothetical protein
VRTALLASKTIRNPLNFYHAGFETRVENILNSLSDNYSRANRNI